MFFLSSPLTLWRATGINMAAQDPSFEAERLTIACTRPWHESIPDSDLAALLGLVSREPAAIANALVTSIVKLTGDKDSKVVWFSLVVRISYIPALSCRPSLAPTLPY